MGKPKFIRREDVCIVQCIVRGAIYTLEGNEHLSIRWKCMYTYMYRLRGASESKSGGLGLEGNYLSWETVIIHCQLSEYHPRHVAQSAK